MDFDVESVVGVSRTRIHYGLLRWDDIVRSRFPRANLTRLVTIPALWWRLGRSGYIGGFWREAWQFATVIIVVHVLYVLLVAVSLGLAAALVSASPVGDGDWLLQLVLILPSAYGILALLTRMTKGRPFYIAHLVDDAAFTHAHASGGDRDMRERLDAWAGRIHAAESDASEVVVVGHSSSSFLALEALDRVLTRDPAFGRRGTPVTLLTLGSVIPWIALDPRAHETRTALQRVADMDAIGWLDLRAPWDWLSIHLRDPLAAVGLVSSNTDRPATCSVEIGDLIEPDAVTLGRWNFFRMHFQLLMSSRAADGFDFVALIAGEDPVHRAIERLRDSPVRPAHDSAEAG